MLSDSVELKRIIDSSSKLVKAELGEESMSNLICLGGGEQE